MPPENAGYMVAAYIVAAGILLGIPGRCFGGQGERSGGLDGP